MRPTITCLSFLTSIARGSPPCWDAPGAVRFRSKLDVYLAFAQGLGGLSTCRRKMMGAVLINGGLTEVVGIGYNGQPAGMPNDGCRDREGGCGCVHAEANALVKCRVGAGNLMMLATASPCETCAGLILSSQRVAAYVYLDEYRDPTGRDLLRRAGIPTLRRDALWDR